MAGTALEFWAAMRFAGQSFTVDVRLDREPAERGNLAAIRATFLDEYERLYAHADRAARVEFIDLRVRINAALGVPASAEAADGDRPANPLPTGKRLLHLAGRAARHSSMTDTSAGRAHCRTVDHRAAGCDAVRAAALYGIRAARRQHSSPAGLRTMDKVLTAIMGNRFNAIVEEGSAVLHRTAFTNYVKLVQDYQCALADPDGEIFAYPALSGVNVFIGLPLRSIIDAIGIENLESGDCIVTNDPFASDGAVTHLMDITLVRPIFIDELVAFSWSFHHASDIGAVPGASRPIIRSSRKGSASPQALCAGVLNT